MRRFNDSSMTVAGPIRAPNMAKLKHIEALL